MADRASDDFQFTNPYDLLGVPQDATREEIEELAEAMRRVLRERPLSEEATARIEEATELLLDDERRDALEEALEDRLFTLQDIVFRTERSMEDSFRHIESSFLAEGDRLRDLSDIGAINPAYRPRPALDDSGSGSGAEQPRMNRDQRQVWEPFNNGSDS